MSTKQGLADSHQPDYSIPSIPKAETPSLGSDGLVNGYAVCEATYSTTRPPVPYGKQKASTSLVTESGFKSVRGMLTEGRYLTFEAGGYAITASGSSAVASKASAKHDKKSQRWVIHQVADGGAGATEVIVSSAVDGRYLSQGGRLTSSKSKAEALKIVDMGNGKGYTLQDAKTGRYLSTARNGKLLFGGSRTAFKIYSVTY